MQGAPPEIDFTALNDRLLNVTGVQEVRDLHIWEMTPGKVVLSAHLLVDGGGGGGGGGGDESGNTWQAIYDKVLERAEAACVRAGAKHVTIQVRYNIYCLCDEQTKTTSVIFLLLRPLFLVNFRFVICTADCSCR
jgi:Co/Zn/Cd efflux system component